MSNSPAPMILDPVAQIDQLLIEAKAAPRFRDDTYDAVDRLDAAMFTGDEFFACREVRQHFRYYLARWEKQLREFDVFDDVMDGEKVKYRMSMARTPWFNGTEKPVRSGVYERKMPGTDPDRVLYSYWNGKCWFANHQNPSMACYNRHALGTVSMYQDDMLWRGCLRNYGEKA